MRLVRDNETRGLSKASVVTIGNFDGLHKGHQALIRRCREQAVDGWDSALVSFEPTPQALFAPGTVPARLTSTRQKLQVLAESGMDLVWLMRFNRSLAGMSARAFAKAVLVDGLAAQHLVIGEDFRFGHGRLGDRELLRELGGEFGFSVDVVPMVVEDGERVSSSAVRKALAAGDFDRAERLMGRPFCMQGRVQRGSRLGRKLGYPTANMKLAASPSPLAGVFAVRARLLSRGENGAWMDAVASLGRRPAVGGREFLVEVHIFDFDEDLYGQRLEVRFLAKLRDESDFENLDALVAQMRKDEAQARQTLREPISTGTD